MCYSFYCMFPSLPSLYAGGKNTVSERRNAASCLVPLPKCTGQESPWDVTMSGDLICRRHHKTQSLDNSVDSMLLSWNSVCCEFFQRSSLSNYSYTFVFTDLFLIRQFLKGTLQNKSYIMFHGRNISSGNIWWWPNHFFKQQKRLSKPIRLELLSLAALVTTDASPQCVVELATQGAPLYPAHLTCVGAILRKYPIMGLASRTSVEKFQFADSNWSPWAPF
jgi:hypothetical protein